VEPPGPAWKRSRKFLQTRLPVFPLWCPFVPFAVIIFAFIISHLVNITKDVYEQVPFFVVILLVIVIVCVYTIAITE
jgi:hypothetical protein